MTEKEKLIAGDVFTIPTKDGRLAIAKIIWMPSGKLSARFRNVFLFLYYLSRMINLFQLLMVI